MECLVLASNAATNSLTIAVIIFLKSLNTWEREEIKAVAHQSHFRERRRLPQPQQMTNPLLQGTPFDPNVGNQVQVNQVDIFMEEFLVVLDLLFDHVQYEVWVFSQGQQFVQGPVFLPDLRQCQGDAGHQA